METQEPLETNEEENEKIPAAITDIGCEREINEDRYAVIDSVNGRAWICCDGMGGSLGGELAAQLAIDAIRRVFETGDFANSEQALKSSIDEANRIILLRRQNPAFSSMGTTVVGAIINNDQVVITHAGDSRAYLVREGEIKQLTKDHTYVQDLVDRGNISPEEALSHPQSHVLTKCLGAQPRLGLETSSFWIWDNTEAKDYLVLCTDGLYSLVTDQEIAYQINNFSPQKACVNLVELARNRGGFDNITLTVLPMSGELKTERDETKVVVESTKKKSVFSTSSTLTTKNPVVNPISNLDQKKKILLVVTAALILFAALVFLVLKLL